MILFVLYYLEYSFKHFYIGSILVGLGLILDLELTTHSFGTGMFFY